MKKVVINACYGGFGISEQAKEDLAKKKGMSVDDISIYLFDMDRDDTDLISLIEEKGVEYVNGELSSLTVEEYDEEKYSYSINEYDGWESLELIPIVSEKKIAECASSSEIMDYLESLGIEVKRIK